MNIHTLVLEEFGILLKVVMGKIPRHVDCRGQGPTQQALRHTDHVSFAIRYCIEPMQDELLV